MRLKTEDACAVYIVNSSVFRSVIILVLDVAQIKMINRCATLLHKHKQTPPLLQHVCVKIYKPSMCIPQAEASDTRNRPYITRILCCARPPVQWKAEFLGGRSSSGFSRNSAPKPSFRSAPCVRRSTMFYTAYAIAKLHIISDTGLLRTR